MRCVSCSQPLSEGARFCSFCGHEVQAGRTEERRVVTVLFVDLVGYTALTEHMDPERVKRLVDDAFQRLIAEIDRFGGRVDKLLGDGILALFGAPVAHEDDPDRAVRAAIEMHRALKTYSEEHPDLEQDLRLRIGVNTGEVVVGSVSGADYTAMGDVVNLASRLQTMAPPGGTYVGSTTEAQLSPSIERVLAAEERVRGRKQLEQIFEVTGRFGRAVPGGSRHDLTYVGRSSQRELFTSVMGLVADGQGAVVSVTGEAGSGKTRLVAEALARFPSRDVVVFSGVCAPYGENNVWAPIANALFKLMATDRSLAPDRLREMVERRGRELYGFEDTDPRIHRFVEGAMHLFGYPSEFDRIEPRQTREILMQVVVEGVHRRSQRSPVVVWIDDLQWADPLMIELLGRLGRSLVDRPVLLVTAQRDDADIAWPPAHDHPITVRMPLDPLSRVDCDTLVKSVLGGDVSPRLLDQLFERSGGNPLFLTQLSEVARDRPGDEQLPGSLRALIAARLDALPLSQRQLLDNASVIGASGPLVAFDRFADEMRQSVSPGDVDALIEGGLLDVEDTWWRFRSDVVREVVYQTLTKSARAQRHAGTAAVMESYSLAPIDQIAHHTAAAAELVAEIGPIVAVPDDITDRAIDLLGIASQRSLDVGAFSQAIRQSSRALDLLGPESNDDVRRRFLLSRARAWTERRDSEAALADATKVAEMAVSAGDVRHEAIARRLIGVVAQQQGDLDLARRELSTSVDLLRELGDEYELTTSLSDRGFVEVFGGSLREADRILAEAEAMANDLEDRRRLAWIRQHQAWVAFLSGDTRLAEERLIVSSGLFDDVGDKTGTGWAFGLLAYVRFFERRFTDAEELAVAVRREALDLGELWAPAMMDSLLASIRLWTGRFSEAEELSRRALSGFRELNDRFGIVQALAPRMRALVALGRNQEAERGLEETLSMADSFGDLAIPIMAAAGTAAHLGLGARVVALGEIAVARMLAMHADGSEAQITLALGFCQVGDPDRALAVLLEVREPGPYSRAVSAVAEVMAGIADQGLVDADLVQADESSTYLDRVLADVAAGAALIAVDRSASALRLERARATAEAAGDAAASALATSASIALVDGYDGADVEHLGDGWKTVIAGLVASAATTTPDGT